MDMKTITKDSKIVIHLKTGHKIEGQLARPFSNDDTDIEIWVSDEQRRHLFAIDEICALRFQKTFPLPLPDSLAMIEEIQTLGGETFRVAVYSNINFLKGFLCIDRDESSTYRTIFFAFSGIRYRKQIRRIGELLQDHGFVTNDHINEALKTQDELRNRRLGEVVSQTLDISHDSIEKTFQEIKVKPDIPRNVRIGDILVEAGLLKREQIEKAFELQQNGKRLKIGEILISQGLITEQQLLYALSKKFRLPLIDLDTVAPSEQALAALSEGIASRLHVLPIEFDGRTLVIATSTPTDLTIGDNLRFSTKYDIEIVAAPAGQISAGIEKYYHKANVDTFLETMEDAQPIDVEDEVDDVHVVEPDSKVINLVNRILIDAYHRRASDIHFEPGVTGNPLVVRYRIDGECMVAHRVPAIYKPSIISRIKIMSRLDITERRRPQSGKILLRSGQRRLEYRVEVTPIVGDQEAVVLRLVSASKPLALDEMGLSEHNLEWFKDVLDKPYGMILCVGPTGSGKTTTLHSALVHINTATRKIWTVEDPVEITQPGLCQVQVNTKIGYSFAEALRSFLRADPDVIMVGEMRDDETAKIAINASLTGHLVLSTLHTNSAPETVVRLIEMGLDPFNFADALLIVIAQRLARKLCDNCKTPKQPTRWEYDMLIEEFVKHAGKLSDTLPSYDDAAIMVKNGCQRCEQTGYIGRIALHELMVATPAIKNALRERKGVEEIRRIALSEGMWTLKMDGIGKIFQGQTDLMHVNKACL
jgi:type II secretory ATPase GspE/PulE/Tfp pilus assembly ATPase PilB-like protein